MSTHDRFCGTCAYRVNARVVRDASIAYELQCKHAKCNDEFCADARDERGACGVDARLYVKRADAKATGAAT